VGHIFGSSAGEKAIVFLSTTNNVNKGAWAKITGAFVKIPLEWSKRHAVFNFDTRIPSCPASASSRFKSCKSSSAT
jgi:hypothetical protein